MESVLGCEFFALQAARKKFEESEICTANDVPGTFSYYYICFSVDCIPLDYCENIEW